MKKRLSLALIMALTLSLTACGGGTPAQDSGGSTSLPAGKEPAAAPVDLSVSAASSLTEALDKIIEQYKTVAPNVNVIPTYDSSGTLLTQISSGADCDIFLSAAPKQMDTIDATSGKDGDGLVYIDSATRVDLLENKVVLAVPQGNPKGINSFDQLATLLKTGDILLAMGNSDVPVGQYTQKIFAHYGLEEETLASAGVLTYGSNVKEVTSQVTEATVDCGIIYATDAATAGLTAVDTATAKLCGQVVYPAAVLSGIAHPDEATAFLEYLKGADAAAAFIEVGFTPLRK